MKSFKQLAALLIGAGVIVTLDQITKELVRNRLAFGEVWEPIPALAPFIRVVHWQNTGAAFGILPEGGMVFAVIAFLVIGAIIYYYPQIPREHRLLRLALVLQLGGAIGNLVDRLIHGPVTDFVAVGGFPVFNVADASISVGVAVLILSMWFEDLEGEQPDEVGAGESASDPEPGVG